MADKDFPDTLLLGPQHNDILEEPCRRVYADEKSAAPLGNGCFREIAEYQLVRIIRVSTTTTAYVEVVHDAGR